MSYTTTDLIASIKRRASVPTNQNLFSNDDFLSLANEEMNINLIPQLLSIKEEYFVADYDVTVTSGTSSYSIPTRAIGLKLRDVQLISNGNVSSLPRLYEDDRASTSEQRTGFYLKGNNVVISPTPANSSDTLRLSHFRRPNELVTTAECAQISSIDINNNQVTVSTLPSTISTSTVIDFIRGSNGFECLGIDYTVSGVSGTTVTFTSLPTSLAVGDWIALAQETPIPQIPVELHSVLAQMVAVKCLEAMGDSKVEIAEQKLQLMKSAAFNLLSPRVDGENKKITNPYSILSSIRR